MTVQRKPKVGNLTAWFIYVLRDPRTFDVRYVGFSKDPESRLLSHLAESIQGDRSHKCNWIRSLLRLDLKPVLGIVESGVGLEWECRERHWIQQFRYLGENLTNATLGGDGAFGMSDETRAKIAESRRGPQGPRSPEARARMKAAAKFRKAPGIKGQKQSPELIQKRSETLKRRIAEKGHWLKGRILVHRDPVVPKPRSANSGSFKKGCIPVRAFKPGCVPWNKGLSQKQVL